MTLFYPHKLNEDLDVPFKFGDVGIWIVPSLTETRRKIGDQVSKERKTNTMRK